MVTEDEEVSAEVVDEEVGEGDTNNGISDLPPKFSVSSLCSSWKPQS